MRAAAEHDDLLADPWGYGIGEQGVVGIQLEARDAGDQGSGTDMAG
jgi:hypothetical protein